jgi:hypothetical protein
MKRITEVEPADKARIVAEIAAGLDRVEAHITTEASRQRLFECMYQMLHQGTLAFAQVEEWYRAGNPAADLALRKYCAEELDNHRETAQVRNFAVKHMAEPFLNYPAGRSGVMDNLTRDIAIRCVADIFAGIIGVPLTRGRGTETPSVGYFISRATKARGWKLKEQQINRIILNFDRLPAQLENAARMH